MKNLYSLCLALIISFNGFAQTGNSHCSPQTRLFLKYIAGNPDQTDLPKSYVYKQINHQNYISGLIKVSPSFFESQLTSLGVLIGTKAGLIYTVQIPLNVVRQLAELSTISYLELDVPTFPNLDNARLDTHVDSVHSGYNLPMPYTGQGVVVGVVDVGFDFGHPSFFDTAGTNYRVKRVWLQKNNSGTAPSNFAYGSELTDTLQMWNQGTDNIEETHGTHVTGICAGAGYGSPTAGKKFKGFSYKSDIVLVAMTPDKSQWINTGISDMIDGISYVYDYAASVSKPADVNLSWGSPLGPHDGTSLFSQALDNLTGPGKIFVCSAGNNGTDSIHIQKTFTPIDTIVNTFLKIANSPEGKKTWLDVWGESAKTFCLNVSLKNGNIIASTGSVCLDDSIHSINLIGSNNNTLFLSVVTNHADFNGKPRIFVDINSGIISDTILLSITGSDGTIHLWNSFVSNTVGYYGAFRSYNYSNAVNGDQLSNISDISSTNSAIAVGAYASKVQWTNISAQSYSYASYVAKGNLVPFSSHGPTVDGRIKPDITGPGLTVGSSISSYDSAFMSTGASYLYVVNKIHFATTNRDYPYGQLSGTSMSSPAVTGITALLLQVKNDLTPQEVKDIYTLTAIQDSWTGVIPQGGNNNWGNGKVNAMGAVFRAAQLAPGISSINTPAYDVLVYPNPTDGLLSIDLVSKKNENLSISIYDIVGRTVELQSWAVVGGYNKKQIDLSAISNGIYYFKISSENGSSITKFLKK